jgi:cytochrome oxidase assembly protein ShyY1
MRQMLTTPRWLALTAVSLVAIAAFAAMGVWQWARADIREEVAAANPLKGPAVPIEGVLAAGTLVPQGAAPRPVTAAGSYDPEAQLVVPGRAVDGAGRDVVVTVLRLDRGDGVLVARGSIAPGQPAPPPPAGRVVVEGWLLAGEPLAAGDDIAISPVPLLDAVDYDLADAYVGLIGQRPAVTAADPTPLPAPEPETELRWNWRNLLYAVQWWFFAAAVVTMWALGLRLDLRREREEVEAAAAAASGRPQA